MILCRYIKLVVGTLYLLYIFLTFDTGILDAGQLRWHYFRSKYDELERALLTVKCLMPALASLWNACRQGPHSLGKHYPLFYARFESFHNGNRLRQQSLITLLGLRLINSQERTKIAPILFYSQDRQKALVSKEHTMNNDTENVRMITSVSMNCTIAFKNVLHPRI